MQWVVKSIMAVFLDLFCELFKNLSVGIVATVGCNIGAKFPTIANPNVSFVETLSSFIGKTDSAAGELDAGNMGNFFDMIFPMSKFKIAMIVTGLTILMLLVLWELMKGLTGGLLGEMSEDPGSFVARIIVSIVAVFLSYQVLLTLEYCFNNIYIEFQKQAFSKGVVGADIKTGKGFDYNTIAESKDITKNLDDSVSFLFSSDSSAIKDKGALTKKYDNASKEKKSEVEDPKTVIASEKSEKSGLTSGLFSVFVSFFAIVAILINYVKLVIEVIERYIVLGVLFYSAPLAFSTTATKNSSSIFWAYIRMVLSEMLLMMFSLTFLTTFVGAMHSVSSGIMGNDKLTTVQYMVVIFMLVAWLLVGQHIDAYLKGLGLNTAQTGNGLGSALYGSYKMGSAAVKGGMKRLSKGKNAIAGVAQKKAAKKEKDEKSGKAGMKQHNTGQEAANAISNFGTNSATSPAQSKAMADLAKNAKRAENAKGIGLVQKADGSVASVMTDEGREAALKSSNPMMKNLAENARKINSGAAPGEGAWVSADKGVAARDVQAVLSASNGAGAKSLAQKMEAAGAKDPKINSVSNRPYKEIFTSSGNTLYGQVEDFAGINPARLSIGSDGSATINDFSSKVSFRDSNGNLDLAHFAVANGGAPDIDSVYGNSVNDAMQYVGNQFGLEQAYVPSYDLNSDTGVANGFSGIQDHFTAGDFNRMIPVVSNESDGRRPNGFIMPTDMVTDDMLAKYDLTPHNVNIGETYGECSDDAISCVFMTNNQIRDAIDNNMDFFHGKTRFENYAYDGENISGTPQIAKCDFDTLSDALANTSKSVRDVFS